MREKKRSKRGRKQRGKSRIITHLPPRPVGTSPTSVAAAAAAAGREPATATASAVGAAASAPPSTRVPTTPTALARVVVLIATAGVVHVVTLEAPLMELLLFN